jgi:hypothetical protein
MSQDEAMEYQQSLIVIDNEMSIEGKKDVFIKEWSLNRTLIGINNPSLGE